MSENLRVLRAKERLEQDVADLRQKLENKEGQSKTGMLGYTHMYA